MQTEAVLPDVELPATSSWQQTLAMCSGRSSVVTGLAIADVTASAAAAAAAAAAVVASFWEASCMFDSFLWGAMPAAVWRQLHSPGVAVTRERPQ